MELNHARGSLTIESGDVVSIERGKNLITRKEWVNETRISADQVKRILVLSRDRLTFGLRAMDASDKPQLEVGGIRSKTDLDGFMRGFAALNPDASLELAHPSLGLPDPAHEEAKKAAKRASEFNAAEQKRREKALGARPELKVKTYDNHKDFERDAKKMARSGWMPEQQASDKGRVSVRGTVAKTVLTGGLGMITGLSHKSNKLTVTWVKQPPGFIPKDFLDVPAVPEPRSFPSEPYFNATLTGFIKKGQEFGATPRFSPAPQSVQSEQAKVESSEASASTAGKLRELAALRDEGIISDEEFQAKKSEMMANF